MAWASDNGAWIYFYYLKKNNFYSMGKKEMLPINTQLLVERQQLFLIISLGEVITAALAQAHEESNSSSGEHDSRRLESSETDDSAYIVPSLGPVILIAMIAGMLKLLLFDLNPKPHPSGLTSGSHALNRTFFSGTCWVLMHMP